MVGFGNQRTWQALRLLAQREASIKQILRVNYGEWPLRGLDIVTDEHLNYKVSLKPASNLFLRVAGGSMPDSSNVFLNLYRATRTLKSAGHAVAMQKERTIWMNRFLLVYAFLSGGRQILNTTLAHERRHIQQDDFAHPQKAAEVFGASFVDEGVKGHEPPIAHIAVNELIQGHVKEMSRTQRLWRHFVTANRMGWRVGRLRYLRYLQRGIEIQARLDEVLMAGYPKWPHMPLSKPELWAAVINAGLSPPRHVQKQLTADLELQAASKKFLAPITFHSRAMKELNVAIHNLPSKKAQTMFWFETLPILYSDILESWGDR